MLYGRSAEISALDEVIARAPGGFGGAVVLRGEAGAGKSRAYARLQSKGIEHWADLQMGRPSQPTLSTAGAASTSRTKPATPSN